MSSASAEQIKTKVIKWLVGGGLGFNTSIHAIATEVLFSKNKRKADLLIIANGTHTLEIKSDADNTDKLSNQLKDYKKTFDKVSVITTAKHLAKIRKLLPSNTGLILFDNEIFKIVRPAKRNPLLNKSSLLMFLPKNELLRYCRVKNAKAISSDALRKKIASRLNTKEIRQATLLFLQKRYTDIFKIFLNDTKGNAVWDELRGLCGKIDKLYG